MEGAKKLTYADLMSMPDDGKRYELIDGELNVSKHPHVRHQFTCGQLVYALDKWNDTGAGGMLPGFRCQVAKLFYTQPSS
jgi:hypothetical protein